MNAAPPISTPSGIAGLGDITATLGKGMYAVAGGNSAKSQLRLTKAPRRDATLKVVVTMTPSVGRGGSEPGRLTR